MPIVNFGNSEPIKKYSPDQTRDDHGRFSFSSGSGGPNSSFGSKDLQTAHEGIAKVAENLSFHLTGGTESDARLDARDKVKEAKQSIDNASKLSGEPALREMQDGVNALYSALSLFQDHADQTGSRYANNVVMSLSKELDSYASKYKEVWDSVNKSSDPLVKYSPDQERDDHGRFADQGGGSSDSPKSDSGWSPRDNAVDYKKAEEAAKALINGGVVRVSPKDAIKVVRDIADKTKSDGIKPVDLTNMEIKGTQLYTRDNLGISRDKMPQIPDDKREEWLKSLGDTKVVEETVKPNELHPVQSEMDVASVADKMDNILDKGWKGSIIVSSDNYVMDGHHRWAGASLASFEQPDLHINITRVDMPHDELLKQMLDFNKEAGIQARGLGKSFHFIFFGR
jgi:hypothetical protein